MSPTVLLIDAYRFFFYSKEETRPHIHVEEGGKEAKFWVAPVDLAKNNGFASHELNKIKKLLIENEKIILEKWRYFHG